MFTLNVLAFVICCLMGIGFYFCNSMLEVRESAGQAFSTLYKVLLCVSLVLCNFAPTILVFFFFFLFEDLKCILCAECWNASN